MTQWANWAGTERAVPSAVVTPGSAGEIAALVTRAADRGGTVKMVGTGHSFTAISRPEDVMLRPGGMTGIVEVDREAMTVTALAGTSLHVLNRELEALGLSLHNMGDIAAQTLAGATSTGTHGTGGVAAGLAAQLAGLELVTGTGEVLRASEAEHPDVFAVARVGLGALGVLTRLTFRVEPLFVLEADERPMAWDEALASYDEMLANNHHCDLYWFPHTDRVVAKLNNRLDVDPAEAEPRHPLAVRLDHLLSDLGYAALQRLGNAVPRTIPPANRLSARLFGTGRYSDVAHRVFTSPREVRFREMEYAVPRAAGLDALREARALMERKGWRVGFPVEIRCAPADDIALSTASGRDSVYLAFHVNARTDHKAYFTGVEEVLRSFDGRPHWGKLHTRTAADLAPAYPRWQEFAAVRDRLDPRRVFANAHLRRVLGP
jgi:FAD-linked oxidoreductase